MRQHGNDRMPARAKARIEADDTDRATAHDAVGGCQHKFGAIAAPEQSSPRLVSTRRVEARTPLASRELMPPTTAKAGEAAAQRAAERISARNVMTETG
jgi:hypothetical protein